MESSCFTGGDESEPPHGGYTKVIFHSVFHSANELGCASRLRVARAAVSPRPPASWQSLTIWRIWPKLKVRHGRQRAVGGEVSFNKVEANRRNALHSTGPKTPEGKAHVRLNALKHGFLSKQIVISSKAIGEDSSNQRCNLFTN